MFVTLCVFVFRTPIHDTSHSESCLVEKQHLVAEQWIKMSTCVFD